MRHAARSCLVLGTALALAAAARLHSQVAPAPGDQVRAETPRGRVEGTLLAPLGERVQLRDKGGALHDIAADSVRRLDLAVGRSSNVWRGLAIGAGVGVTAAIIMVATVKSCTPPPGTSNCVNYDEVYAPVAGGIVAVGAAALGAGIGALTHHTRWQRVQPSSAGFGLLVSF